ncbi:P-loop containing nucleoside triphosphate hydrolase protein [Panus rudis PR-1116 ss-1]|nr:P-loop containing nucleoside triphosphate hydrolase protein [Panus rudis PR-1116 ss-1]
MEAFQLLSRGGVKFDKRRFEGDLKLFNKGAEKVDKGKSRSLNEVDELPADLDFFKYAQGGNPKRKSASGAQVDDRHSKKLKTGHDSDPASIAPTKQGGTQQVPRQRITAKGSNVPDPINSFGDLKSRFQIGTHILANLEQNGFTEPTGIQAHGIPILMERRDIAAISPTGTGKTLAYLLPIMALLGTPAGSSKNDTGSGVRALIIAPTRELAHQIHNECLKLAQGRKWRIVLFSKATASTLADKNVRDKVDIIISTPLRLVSAMQAGNLDLSNVRHLVLDEADRLLDSEFLDQVQEVVAGCTWEGIQKAVFSATLPAGAEKVAMDMMNDPIRIVVGLKDTPLPLISQSLTYVADDFSKLPSLLQYLSQPYNPPVLIFVSSQDRASSLAEELVLSGIPNVDHLHAGMTKKEREDAVSRMRQGHSWVMVTTEVMARGMDFKGVREVINYDFPPSVQSYVHRIGRTGRMGREGKAVTYFTNDDAPFLKTIANVILQSGSSVPEWILKLPKPSKMKRREMGKIKRAETVDSAHRVGKKDAIKRREMIAASKRRKEKAEKASHDAPTVEAEGNL